MESYYDKLLRQRETSLLEKFNYDKTMRLRRVKKAERGGNIDKIIKERRDFQGSLLIWVEKADNVLLEKMCESVVEDPKMNDQCLYNSLMWTLVFIIKHSCKRTSYHARDRPNDPIHKRALSIALNRGFRRILKKHSDHIMNSFSSAEEVWSILYKAQEYLGTNEKLVTDYENAFFRSSKFKGKEGKLRKIIREPKSFKEIIKDRKIEHEESEIRKEERKEVEVEKKQTEESKKHGPLAKRGEKMREIFEKLKKKKKDTYELPPDPKLPDETSSEDEEDDFLKRKKKNLNLSIRKYPELFDESEASGSDDDNFLKKSRKNLKSSFRKHPELWDDKDSSDSENSGSDDPEKTSESNKDHNKIEFSDSEEETTGLKDEISFAENMLEKSLRKEKRQARVGKEFLAKNYKETFPEVYVLPPLRELNLEEILKSQNIRFDKDSGEKTPKDSVEILDEKNPLGSVLDAWNRLHPECFRNYLSRTSSKDPGVSFHRRKPSVKRASRGLCGIEICEQVPEDSVVVPMPKQFCERIYVDLSLICERQGQGKDKDDGSLRLLFFLEEGKEDELEFLENFDGECSCCNKK